MSIASMQSSRRLNVAQGMRRAKGTVGSANFQAAFRRRQARSVYRAQRWRLSDKVRGHNADPYSEHTPICDRFEF
jgi:hypothetical protein